MLWVSGTICLLIWFVLYFLFHKTGMVHGLLPTVLALYVVQFAQDRRTRFYDTQKRS